MAAATTDVDTIVVSPRFRIAMDDIREQHGRFVDEIVALTEVPAPPFGEERRALAFEAMLRNAELSEVGRDAIGNVIGIRRGRVPGSMLAVTAHLDTVFPDGTDCTVRRLGTRLHAPGIGDDARGLAALLAYARALGAGDIETERDLLFVGTVGEEGTGDLRGVRHLFTEGVYRDDIGGFFTIDGLEIGTITTTAVGSRRYHVAFRGPGGHSMIAFGSVNPAHAMAAVVRGLSHTEVPAAPTTTFCASVFGGGTSVNAIPEEVWVEVDLRSEDQRELDRLDDRLHELVEAAVEEENERGDTEAGRVTAEMTRIGDRPAGRTDPSEPIVRAALASARAFGFAPGTDSSSTDANIPMSMGVPAIRLGSGGTGDRPHTLDEWIDVEPELSARGLGSGLAAILATAGMYTD